MAMTFSQGITAPAATDSAAGDFSSGELRRYHRHLILPEIGIEGQARLKDARVLLVGAGGLGSPVGLYLAAAGVGTIGVVDGDVVDETNLHRQVIHGTSDVGRAKTESARERIADINPHVAVEVYATRLTSANAMSILAGYDVIVDGTDNFQTRYLVNDASVLLGIPNVYGSVLRFDGQASVFGAHNGPCYRCLFREPPPPGLVPSCAEGGVLGVLPGLIGLVQATETVKLITGIGEPLIGRLLLVDALRMQFRTIELRRDPECRACGTREITAPIDYEAFCGGTADAPPSTVEEIDPRELKARLDRGDRLRLIDVREPYEWEIAHLPQATLIPVGEIEGALPSLDRADEIVVHCHHGARSAAVAALLRRAGFGRVLNLAGGIDRWSVEVDPGVARY